MVDDFENYADLNGGATAGTIREAADSPSTHAATLQTLVSDLADDSQKIRSTIEGDFQDATTMNLKPANDAARRLTQSGLYAVGLLNSLADTVETFDKEVEKLNTELHDNTYARWQAQNNTPKDNSEAGSGGGGKDDGPPELSYNEIKAQEKAKLQGRYNTAHTALENEADRIAGLFEGSPDPADVKQLVLAGYIPLSMAGVWPDLKLNAAETKQAQLNTVKNMTDAEQVEYIKNTKDIDPAIAAVITPAAQKTLANDVAKDIENKTVDADTVRMLAVMEDQQAFAHALYTRVSPDEMTGAIEQLSHDAYPNGPFRSGSSYGSGMEPLDQDKIDLYKKFLSTAGGTLATYSTGTGDYAPPSNAGTTWGKAITDDDHPQNAGALSLLLREGGENNEFDGKFLSDVGDTVYKYERDHEDDQPWGSRGSQVIDPDAKIGNNDDNYWGVRSSDAMANVLGAMKSSPDAAQLFFADGYPEKDGEPDLGAKNDRLEYLLTERTWAKDMTDTKGGDEGDGLGLALEAATLGNRTDSTLTVDGDTTTRHDEIGAALATQTLQTIADKAGTDGGTFRHEWHVSPGMRDSLGAIVGGHVNDVFDIAATDGRTATDSPFHPGPPPGLNLSADDLGKVISEIGRGEDKTGLEILTTSAVNYNNQLTSTYLSNHDGHPKTIDELRDSGVLDDLSDQASKTGHGLNFIFEHGLEGGLSDEKAKEERAAILSKALDVGTSFIPSPPGGKLVEVLTSEGTDWIKDQLTATPGSGSSADANKAMTGDMKSNLEFGTYNALIQNGYLNQQEDPRYGIPPSALDPGNPHRIDPSLHNSKAGDVDRDGNGVDPETGRKYTAEEEYSYWKSGPHPEEQAEKDYNGPPSTIFQDYLNAYAGAAYGTEPK